MCLNSPVLELRSFGVGFDERTVFKDITFSLAKTGLTCLLGPAGSGKSTLLRTLAGLNNAHSSLQVWGTAICCGKMLNFDKAENAGTVASDFGFVMQHARFFVDSVRENLVSALPNRSALLPAQQTTLVTSLLTDNGLGELISRLHDNVAMLPKAVQRRLAIVRSVVANPSVLLADEPTAGLDEQEAMSVMELLQKQALSRAVLYVTHHQRSARLAKGTVILLAAGKIQEIASSEVFFTSPQSDAAKVFLRTGGYSEPQPDPSIEVVAQTPAPATPVKLPERRSKTDGPRGFFWLWHSKLGGLPRPGIVRDVENDLEGLVRVGITTLVNLEETATIDLELLTKFQLRGIHFPIQDMGVPSIVAAVDFCQRIHNAIASGESVAIHCRAGLGRTGTMLASQLIYEGNTALSAIERVRQLNPRCIQSDKQVEFLSAFERHVIGNQLTVSRTFGSGN